MTAIGSPPTNERGTSGDANGLVRFTGRPYGWSSLSRDAMEHVPELQWKPGGRGAVGVYHQMRTDAQVQGLYLGSTLPIRRYSWHINPNGARQELVDKMCRDYNLPVHGKEDAPRGRTKRRFAFRDHIRHALLAILYGHMYFEQVGEIAPDGMWHLRKLGVRMPQTLQEIRVDKDGGLKSIVQRSHNFTGSFQPALSASDIEIKVSRLLAYIWEQEGGDWTGRSMLRGIHKNWLLKDRILRVGAINIERAGGVPYIKGPRDASGADLEDLAQMATQFRVGENAGGAIPWGAELELARAAGGEDAINYIKLQNEEMGRGWLMMFLNLGQTTSGSRALGGSFIDYALNAQETIADWICDTFNEHMLEDDAEWNYILKDEDTVPLLGYTRNDDRQLAVADLVAMVENGIIQLDDELEAWIREEYRMPRPGTNPRPLPKSAPTTSPDATAAERGTRAAPTDTPPRSLSRPLSRAIAQEDLS